VRARSSDVAIELEVLEPVVEQVHRGAEMTLGEASRQVAIARAEDGDARELARQHQRLVAGTIEIGAHALGVAHDHDAVLESAAGVSAAEDRRALPHLPQQARERGHGRRLAASAHSDVPHADDGIPQPPPKIGPAGVELASAAGDGGVERAQHRR
jgi:hypothetical protein